MGLEVKINCLSTYIDPKNKEIVSKGEGKSKKELEAGEPFVEIPAYIATEQDLARMGLTKQDVNKRAEERNKKRHGGNAKNIDIR